LIKVIEMEKLTVRELVARREEIDLKRSEIKHVISTLVRCANDVMSGGEIPDPTLIENADREIKVSGVVPYSAVWQKGEAMWFVDLRLADGKDQITGLSFYWDKRPRLSYDHREGKYKFWGDTDLTYEHLQFFVDKLSAMLTKLTGQVTDVMAHI
jgi:hypothetical protein